VLLAMFAPVAALAQEDVAAARGARNVVFVELAGNAGVYSVNYARRLGDDCALRVGLEYFAAPYRGLSGESGIAKLLMMPLLFDYLGIGSRDHKLELAAGPVLGYASASIDSDGAILNRHGVGIAGTAVVGYRYLPHDGGFTFNMGFTPVFSAAGFLPWLGLGFGAAL
jgi:hypothetical protein